MADKKAFHEQVAEKLIEQLKQGTAPWQKPWAPGEAGAAMPMMTMKITSSTMLKPR